MDIATILGILSGIILIGYTIAEQSDASIFINVPGMMIVFGGSIAAILVNFSLKEVIGVMKIVKNVFRKEQFDALGIINTFTELSREARREGILAIDKLLPSIEDDFMRSGLEMAVDGMEPETIRSVMEIELNYLTERHKKGQQIFSSLGAYAPAFGMIGTLIGLIAMLRTLDNPENIGYGMAVALTTTFYGSILANLAFLPIAGKLKNKSEEEVVIKEMIIEGVLSMQLGEHPRSINQKLLNFLPPKMRISNKDKGLEEEKK